MPTTSAASVVVSACRCVLPMRPMPTNATRSAIQSSVTDRGAASGTPTQPPGSVASQACRTVDAWQNAWHGGPAALMGTVRRPPWVTVVAYTVLTLATAIIAYPLLFILLGSFATPEE